MEKLTINNYEAFYLDYLEGTLSQEETQQFLVFLEENPSLKMEDDALFYLEKEETISETNTLPDFEKMLLKKEVNISELNANTLDYFLIARTEKLLTQKEETQLTAWLNTHPSYIPEATVYAKTRLIAPEVIFTHKQQLLRKKAPIVSIAWASTAVAASLLFVVGLQMRRGIEFTNFTSPTIQLPSAQVEKKDSNSRKDVISIPSNKAQKKFHGTEKEQLQNTPEEQKEMYQVPIAPSTPKDIFVKNQEIKKESLENIPLENKDLTQINNPNNGLTNVLIQEENKNTDLAYVPFSEMKNPLKLLTNGLSNKLNTPLDFRKAEPTKDKAKGFFLKIGKLEISHRSSKK